MNIPSVWCICLGVGFPGLAQANRITMIGKALQDAGWRFRVCHLGANPYRDSPLAGVHEGITFQYYPKGVQYSQSRIARQISYLRGMQQLLRDMATSCRNGERIFVYSWLATNPASMWFLYRLRKISIPIITERSEWWPGARAHILRVISILQSDGGLVISDAIENRMRMLWPGRNNLIFKIPILTDVRKIIPADTIVDKGIVPRFLWCGEASANPKDIQFMLQVMAELVKRTCVARLIIAGHTTTESAHKVRTYMSDLGIPDEMVEIAGYLPDDQLLRQTREASGLLLPLWADEERSICRFPTKLGAYLASARPVITSPVGDVGYYLKSGPAAFLCPSGDVVAYADAIEKIIKNPHEAEKTGQKGREVAGACFDFRNYSKPLAAFFKSFSKAGTQ